MIWVLDYIEDLDADFLRFYRIDGFLEMDSVRFFSLALRLGFYDGVIAGRIRIEHEEAEKRNPAKSVRNGEEVKEVPLESFADLIEMR